MKAFVITCNDSVEAVFIGPRSDADVFMEHLAKAYYAKNKYNWKSEALRFRPDLDNYEYYRSVVHWAVRDTPTVVDLDDMLKTLTDAEAIDALRQEYEDRAGPRLIHRSVLQRLPLT